MFVITNRAIHPNRRGLAQLGASPSEHGPNELRIVEATKRNGKWAATVLPDVLTDAMKQQVGITEAGDVFASEYVARSLQQRIRRHVLFYVHGFNNDIGDVLDQADALRKLYGMEVIAFSWPARGGGAVSGTLSYKRDKKAALASVGALDRTIEKLRTFLCRFNDELLTSIVATASATHPGNAAARDTMIAQESERLCPYRVSAVFHSMGNYLFKHALLSSSYDSGQTVFDNVILAAADTNNADHERWVDRISVRRRVYVTINEDDYALRASRIKLGDAQRARLGHYLRELDSRRAMYVDVTGLEDVDSSHAYFLDSAKQNTEIRGFFRRAFRGEAAETQLWFHASENVYRFWPPM